MKVYVITKGEYSDYHICAVTLDKKIAAQLKQRYTDRWNDAEIEEYETDDCNEVLRWKSTYYANKDLSTRKITVSETSCDYSDCKRVSKGKDFLYTHVHANNEQDALKFASDKFAKYEAEKGML